MMTRDLPPGVERLLREQGLFQEKYRLKRLLGSGSFASVIQAEHEGMGRDVALKFLKPKVLLAQPDVGQRFLTEAQLASRLTSPHTVTIFDSGETEDGIPFMVLEYIRGVPLDEAIEKTGALGLRRSIRITLQVLDSLQEAHAHRIIHRDLKPANIMVGRSTVDRRLQVKVLDFGVAKLVGANDERPVTSSGRQSTQFIGTPRYMSPEQILGEEVTPASDLYSLGLILYEMATGRGFLADENVAKVAQAHLAEEPLPLEAIDELPRPLREIIRQATARRVSARYGSAAEFRTAVEEALAQGERKHSEATKAVAVEAHDEERATSEVFSGKAYVAAPAEPEGAALIRTPRVEGRRPRTPGPRRSRRLPSPVGAAGESSNSGLGPGSSQELELDLDALRVQRLQLERQRPGAEIEERKREAQRRQERKEIWLFMASAAGLMVSGFILFVLLSGSLAVVGKVGRFIAGTLPLVLSLLWAVFSENAHPGLVRRRIVPWAKRSLLMIPIALVTLMLILPVEAQASLEQEGLWFLEELPFGPLAEPVRALATPICDASAWLMKQAGRLVPWVR